MHKGLNAVIVLSVVGLILAATWLMDGHMGVWQKAAPDIETAEIAHETAPDIVLTDLAGKTTALRDYEGKVILLNFWATWCTPCIAEFPQFIKLARAMPEDVVILTVSIDDEKAAIGKFLKRYVPDYASVQNVKIFWDQDKKISQDLFQTIRVPETIIITPQMTMARKVAGLSVEWNGDEMKEYLLSLTKTKPDL